AVPAWMIGFMAFGPNIGAVFILMVAIYMLFPFVLLSMMDMRNILMPFSPEVARSVTRCEEAWGATMFSSGVLFFFTFLVYVYASSVSAPAGAVISIFASVFSTFTYFSMIGRLAFNIGQSLNDAPMKNDIESIRERERAEG
ncbi:MAG: hypothetical protein AAGA03_12930, partial [Planctomycetota bacterium]